MSPFLRTSVLGRKLFPLSAFRFLWVQVFVAYNKKGMSRLVRAM